MEETASNKPPSPERHRSRSPPPAPPVEAAVDEATSEIARRTCQVCGRVFDSAKAMWGHSWVHRERRDPPPLQGVVVGGPWQSWKIDSTEEKDRTCPSCGKVFASPKAMFGHLHVHYIRERSRAKGESSSNQVGPVAEPEIRLAVEINGDGDGDGDDGVDSPVSIDLNRPLCMEEDEEGDGEDSSSSNSSIDLNKMPSC